LNPNYKLEQFKSQIKGESVAVVGIGVSNIPLIKQLIKYGAKVTAYDQKTSTALGTTYKQLKSLGVKFSIGDGYLENLVGGKYKYIFKTPGMRADNAFINKAKANGSVITSEIELFMQLCACDIIGVTGSDGKTTTSTLIAQMIKTQGITTHLGGNIGTPLIDKIEQITSHDMVVLELSSFQLQNISVSPKIAVVTNVSPNHLDMHNSMEEYVNAKSNIFNLQNPNCRLVLNYDNAITKNFAENKKAEVFLFSSTPSALDNSLDKRAFVRDDAIFVNDGDADVEVIKISDILVPGWHNVENFLAAIAAVWGIVSIESIINVAKSFKGVEHRIEYVATKNGIKFYNDSIASSPTRTRAALKSFDQKVVLIAGGYDKKIPFDTLAEDIIAHVKKLILIGKTASKIKKEVMNHSGFPNSGLIILNCDSFAGAVQTAYENATNNDVILLSPACASFDMFVDFEHRGKKFKTLVNEI
jgi:UDP-N-acetylmuramoylalanine--D-glutamate ligase